MKTLFLGAQPSAKGGPSVKSLSYGLDSPELVEHLLGNKARHRLSPGMAYRVLGWLRRCTELRANAVAGVPWAIYEKGADPKSDDPLVTSDDAHRTEGAEWLADLGRLFPLFEQSLALEGSAYALKLYERGARNGFQYWSPATVRLEYDAAGGELGDGLRELFHTLTLGPDQSAFELRYLPSEVLYIFQPDPYREAGPGSSSAAAVRTAADVLESVQTFVDQYLGRGAVKATILGVPSDTQPDEKSRLEEWFGRFFSGGRNAGAYKAVNTDAVSVETIGEGLKDLEAPELVEAMREEVAAGMGVPYELIKGQAANYATAEVKLGELYLHTALPQCERVIAPAVNRHVLDELGLFLHFHGERVAALQGYEVARAGAVVKATGRPIMSVNEGRKLLQLKPRGEEYDEIAAPSPALSISTGGSTSPDRSSSTNEDTELDPADEGTAKRLGLDTRSLPFL